MDARHCVILRFPSHTRAASCHPTNHEVCIEMGGRWWHLQNVVRRYYYSFVLLIPEPKRHYWLRRVMASRTLGSATLSTSGDSRYCYFPLQYVVRVACCIGTPVGVKFKRPSLRSSVMARAIKLYYIA